MCTTLLFMSTCFLLHSIWLIKTMFYFHICYLILLSWLLLPVNIYFSANMPLRCWGSCLSLYDICHGSLNYLLKPCKLWARHVTEHIFPLKTSLAAAVLQNNTCIQDKLVSFNICRGSAHHQLSKQVMLCISNRKYLWTSTGLGQI